MLRGKNNCIVLPFHWQHQPQRSAAKQRHDAQTQSKRSKNKNAKLHMWKTRVAQAGFGERAREEHHLSSFGLVLDILRGADLGLDVLEVGQRLIDDTKLLGCGCRWLGWGADYGHFPLLGKQTERARGSRGPRRWRVAGRAPRGDGRGARCAGGGVATSSWTGPHRFGSWLEKQCNWWWKWALYNYT